MTSPDTPVAEIVTFRLAPGIAPSDFLRFAADIGPDLQATGALIRRILSCDDDGLWTDHIEWHSMEAAQKAAREVLALPPAAPFLSAIRPDTVTMRHAPIQYRLTPE